MTVDMRPIEGVFMLENCFITLDGEIFKRLPTKKTKQGYKTIQRNHKTYKVMELAYNAFKEDFKDSPSEDEVIDMNIDLIDDNEEIFDNVTNSIYNKIKSGDMKFDENGDRIVPDMSGDIDWSSTTITEKSIQGHDENV